MKSNFHKQISNRSLPTTKKRKLLISPLDNYSIPLIDLISSHDIVKHVFSFIERYIPVLMFVSKEWYFYFKNQYKINKWSCCFHERGIMIGGKPISPRFIIHDGRESDLNTSFSLICSDAAYNGYLNFLKWARQNGFHWDVYTCASAAANGYLDCLKWLRENGCPWNEYTCTFSAANGHLDCLKWAHENGCPWNERTCSNAAAYGHLDCVLWARDNDCPCNAYICAAAAYNGPSVLNFI